MSSTPKGKLTDKKKEAIRAQVLRIRASGRVNMCDYNSVYQVATGYGMKELATFMANNPVGYTTLIMTGNFE